METNKCKYCGVEPKELGLESFEDDVCPSCKKSGNAIGEVVMRSSCSVDLATLSPFYKEGDYMEVTEWANDEGFDVEMYSRGNDIPKQRFSLMYDEFEAIANVLLQFKGFKPIYYTEYYTENTK